MQVEYGLGAGRWVRWRWRSQFTPDKSHVAPIAWLARTKQAVSKTPDADSLQGPLGYFEGVARLRMFTKGDTDFRKWLRMPHPEVDGKHPLELTAKGQWQAVADFVDDILVGTPG